MVKNYDFCGLDSISMVQKKIYSFLFKIISFIPFTYGGSIHKNCTYFLKSIVKYRKSTIIGNLKNAFPHKSLEDINAIVDQNYQYIIAYVFETIAIYAKKYDRRNIEFNGTEKMNGVLEMGKSIIILGSHYGNWECSSMLLPFYVKTNVYAVYKPLANKNLDIMVKNWRSNYGLKLIAMDDVVKHMSSSKEAEVYIFVSDQRPANINSGFWTNFLNQDTSFYEGAATLSKRYKACVFYQKIFCKEGKYDVHFTELVGDVTSLYIQKLEQDIIEYPAPWLWSHNRWKHKRKLQLT